MRGRRYDSLVTAVVLTICVPLAAGAQPAATAFSASQQTGTHVATTAEPQDTDYDPPRDFEFSTSLGTLGRLRVGKPAA
jgi:hypothetical protein